MSKNRQMKMYTKLLFLILSIGMLFVISTNVFANNPNTEFTDANIIPFTPSSNGEFIGNDPNIPTEYEGKKINRNNYKVVKYYSEEQGKLVVDDKKVQSQAYLVKIDTLYKDLPVLGFEINEPNKFKSGRWNQDFQSKRFIDKKVTDNITNYVYYVPYMLGVSFSVNGEEILVDKGKPIGNLDNLPEELRNIEIKLIDKNNVEYLPFENWMGGNGFALCRNFGDYGQKRALPLGEYTISIKNYGDYKILTHDPTTNKLLARSKDSLPWQNKKQINFVGGEPRQYINFYKLTTQNIFEYIPEDSNNPHKSDDVNIPKKDNEGNFINLIDYVKITFNSENNGTLELNSENLKSKTYLVKKGTKLKELNIPTPKPNDGFEFVEWSEKFDVESEVSENKIYTAKFKVLQPDEPGGNSGNGSDVDPNGNSGGNSGNGTNINSNNQSNENPNTGDIGIMYTLVLSTLAGFGLYFTTRLKNKKL